MKKNQVHLADAAPLRRRAGSRLKRQRPEGGDQAEEALRESEKQHRTVLQAAMDGFWLADTKARLLEVNEAYCRMSGYSARELLAMRMTDLEAIETADELAAHIRKVVARGEDRFESRHRRKDATVFDVEVSVQYRPDDGGRLVVFLRDITERKHVEQRMRMFSQEIIAAREEERRQVSSALHHDVGSLAVGISACLDALEEDLRSGKPGEALRLVKQTRKLFGRAWA